MEPHPEWVEVNAFWSSGTDQLPGMAAGIPGRLRVIYTPPAWNPPLVKGIERDIRYTAFYFDPRTGDRIPAGTVEANDEGVWHAPITPTFSDWVLVLMAE